MIKLVLIDFDDTLSLTEEAFFNIENHIAEKMGFPPMTRKAHKRNWGIPVKKAILERIPGIDADKFMDVHEQVLPRFLENNVVDRISEENINTLKKLNASGKHLTILTSRVFSETKHLLDKNHHINRYIEKIYYADIMKFHKPDPKAFIQALEDFKVLPHEAVYVGDSISDGVSAKGANIHFIALLESGLRTKKDFEEIPVDFFANKFSDIISYVENAK